jgi:hypothetical protein
MPSATTDGDSAVFFQNRRHRHRRRLQQRYLSPETSPQALCIEGEIDSLNLLADLSVTEFMSQGGTMQSPATAGSATPRPGILSRYGHRRPHRMGHDQEGMTLQVKAAQPTLDYDPEAGRQPVRLAVCRGGLSQPQRGQPMKIACFRRYWRPAPRYSGWAAAEPSRSASHRESDRTDRPHRLLDRGHPGLARPNAHRAQGDFGVARPAQW